VGPWDLQLCHQQALLQQQAASELVAHLVDNAWLGASLLQAWRLLQETMAFKIKYQSCAMQAMMSSIHSFIQQQRKPVFWEEAVGNVQHGETKFHFSFKAVLFPNSADQVAA
jgi:hypothetical protein